MSTKAMVPDYIRYRLILITLFCTVSSINVVVTTSSQAAAVVCQSKGCENVDSCCTVTSGSCYRENPLINTLAKCPDPSAPIQEEIPGHQERCPFDSGYFNYLHCPNSFSSSPTQTVGDYGKPDWVGAEFQSLNSDEFSMTVMWKHSDADTLQYTPEYSPVRGYEIRIYEKDHEDDTILRDCQCVTDPSIRNVTIDTGFEYVSNKQALSHMIVEVRSYPSLASAIEQSTRKNCSLLTGCAQSSTSEECIDSRDECYSWPQNCLDFLPSYNAETCHPPLYGPPTSVTSMAYLYYNGSETSEVAMQINIFWSPPDMSYNLFPVPSVYYIQLWNGINYHYFIAKNTTNVTILDLHPNTTYYAYLQAYVPCSGSSDIRVAISDKNVPGCGREYELMVEPPTQTTTLEESLTTTSTHIKTTRLIIYSSASAIIIGFSLILLVSTLIIIILVISRKQIKLQRERALKEYVIILDCKATPTTKKMCGDL